MHGPCPLVYATVCLLLPVPLFARQSTPASSSTSNPQAVALLQKFPAALTAGKP